MGNYCFLNAFLSYYSSLAGLKWITASDTRFNVKPLMNITSTTVSTDAVYSLKTSQSCSFTLPMSSEQREASWQRNHGGRLSVKQEMTHQRVQKLYKTSAECFWPLSTTSCNRVCDFESYPGSAGSGHRGPEEASPVGVLEDVGQDAGEQAGAVQDNLMLFL